MSRIGASPVPIPSGVSVELSEEAISATGPLGENALRLAPELVVSQTGAEITVAIRHDSKRARALWGTQRTLIDNLLTGVSKGFSVALEINGVGYRAALGEGVLNLQLGFSHPIAYSIPDGIEIACERPTAIKVSGVDRQRVGQVAANIRRFRPPEPYKGKGIRYLGERVERKEGKKK
jgi:large subunit ribosomal protein L6